ncbi:MAG: PKD domain-containing protein [Candidatus Diapherotrites archaeon]|nr:PKD domain-containing protein [Candidatus Diapherotrites archaeon]
MVAEEEAQIFMKFIKSGFSRFYALLMLSLIVLFIQVSAKDVVLYINNEDADTQSAAVVLYGPGTFTLTGKIKNNLSVWEETKKIDLVFILDASGSMQDEIDAVKNSIIQIMDQVNRDCPDCMRVGLYVLEGSGSKAGFIQKPNYCHGNDDFGAIYLTSDAQIIKDRLKQVNANCSVEPWAYLIYNILNDSSYGWRSDAVRAIIAITDAADNGCSGGVDNAINALKSYNAYFFGIYGNSWDPSGSPVPDMTKIINSIGRGQNYGVTNSNQIPAKIIQAIKYILGHDDFVVSRQEGPNWDNIGSNFEIKNVARDGGTTTFRIRLQTPQKYPEREVFFKYRLYKKDDQNLYDDAWLKVIMNQPPTARIRALSQTTGDVNLTVVMDASSSTDPDGDADMNRFDWNCGNGQTFRTTKKDEPVSCLYKEKNKTYTVRLTVYDRIGQSSWDEITVTTNPNKPPTNVTINVNPSSPYINQVATFTGSANDPDGYIVKYNWDFGDGTRKSCSDCSTITHAYGSKNTFHVALTVTDNDGDTATGSVDVVIANRAPSKPVLFAYPTSGMAPLHVQFSIKNIEKIDPDGDPIYCYTWDTGDGTQITDCNSYNSSIGYDYNNADAQFDARCKVMDSDGDWSEWSDPVRITTYEIEVMYDFDAKDVNIGTKTEVKAVCTGSIKDSQLNIKIKLDGNILYDTNSPICNGSYHLVDYNFQEPGFYVVEATVLNAPSSCVNCTASDYIYIQRPYPPIIASENNLWLILAVLTLVFAFVKKDTEKK